MTGMFGSLRNISSRNKKIQKNLSKTLNARKLLKVSQAYSNIKMDPIQLVFSPLVRPQTNSESISKSKT